MTSGAYDAMRRLEARLGDHSRAEDVRVIEPGSSFELPLIGT